MNPYQIIKRPHISEKGHEYTESENTYTFRVAMEAAKDEIREAVEQIWNVKVESVRTVIVPGKKKTMGRTVGYRKDWKKAIVRVKEGQAIDALK